MKAITSIALLSLMIIACDTNDQELVQPEPVQTVIKPVLFVEEDFKREYVYNDADQLIQIRLISTFPNGGSMTSTQDFSYLSNGKISETTSDTGFRFVYTYSGNKISRTDEYVYSTWSKYHAFIYDTRGRLTEHITYQNVPEEGGMIPTSKETYQYDASDNLEVTNMYYFTPYGAEAKLLTTFISSHYDDKMNTEDYFDVNVFNPYVTLRKNNPGKLITQNASGNISSTEEYTYHYHPKGYVTSKTTSVTWYHGGTGWYTSTFTIKEY
jgi:hypothetical protein